MFLFNVLLLLVQSEFTETVTRVTHGLLWYAALGYVTASSASEIIKYFISIYFILFPQFISFYFQLLNFWSSLLRYPVYN